MQDQQEPATSLAADDGRTATIEASDAASGTHQAREFKQQPKVASSAPIRLHTLYLAEDGSVPSCDCGRQHIIYGKKYQYCTCGKSKTQPWCDLKSHEGTPFKPTPFTADKKQTYYLLCACKRTCSPPYCDGSHINITWADLEW